MDLKPDKNGLYTLMFKDKNRKRFVLFMDFSKYKFIISRYLGTLSKFEPFCSRPETAPIISRGDSDDIVYVSFQHKDDALRALQGVVEDEDFLELQVAPDCRN